MYASFFIDTQNKIISKQVLVCKSKRNYHEKKVVPGFTAQSRTPNKACICQRWNTGLIRQPAVLRTMLHYKLTSYFFASVEWVTSARTSPPISSFSRIVRRVRWDRLGAMMTKMDGFWSWIRAMLLPGTQSQSYRTRLNDFKNLNLSCRACKSWRVQCYEVPYSNDWGPEKVISNFQIHWHWRRNRLHV